MNLMSTANRPRFHDDTPEARAFRLEQGFVDAAIEGIPRDRENEAFLQQLVSENLSAGERAERIKTYLREKDYSTLAAE